MTLSPGGYDHFFTHSALVEVALLQESHAEMLDLMFTLLLDDPTDRNPLVENLSSGEVESVYSFTLSDLTVFYQFANSLVIRVIHVSAIPFGID